MPKIEVEAKYPLTGTLSDWRERLLTFGARPGDTIRQFDEYFAHPARDFVASGEAFRIRSVGRWNALTYKGPLLDAQTKSRREIEIEFASGTDEAERMRGMLLALGFRPAGCVNKSRVSSELSWQGQSVSLALDEVDRLGMFLEIEIIAPEENWTVARQVLLALAADLGLTSSERRSYLELLAGSGQL